MTNIAGDIAKAKKCAYRLLKYRARSVKEIKDRLENKGFSSGICDEVISELTRLGYLDDCRFADMLAGEIIKFRPGGIAFIRSALKAKGVAPDAADFVIAGIKDVYDEHASAYKLALGRSERLKGVEQKKAKQRLYNFLARRRFNRETILEALSRIYDKQ